MLETLLLSLAPQDLLDVPFYALLASDVPEGFIGDDCLGITGRPLDLALRSHLESRCQWRGRGPALLVNNFAATDHANENAWIYEARFPSVNQLRDAICLASALHEFAHVLSNPIDLDEPDDASELQELWLGAAAIPYDERRSTKLPPWFQHQAPFIRALCHLAGRAQLVGYDVLTSEAFHHETYNLSSLAAYAATLSDEIDAAANQSIADVLATRPPPAFVELWQQDLSEWKGKAKLTGEIETLYAAALRAADNRTRADETFSFASRAALELGVEYGDESDPIDGPTYEGTTCWLAASSAQLDWEAALGRSARPAVPRFRALMYSGGLLPPLKSENAPTVLDLAGLAPFRRMDARLDGQSIGRVTDVANDGSTLAVEGSLNRFGAKREEVLGSAQNGYEWQALMHLTIGQIERVRAGESATVNARFYQGPMNIARQSRLLGIDFDDSGYGSEYSADVTIDV